MVQTFDDLLSEDQSRQHMIAVWLRVGRELPLNIVEEHIHNLEGKKMNNTKPNKRVVIAVSAVAVAAAAIVVGLTLHSNDTSTFTGTTLARVRSVANKPACLQKAKNPAVHISDQENEFIAQAAASSIIDVPAGTTVDAYIKTYTDSKATGTAVYGGSYGTYNFVAERKAKSADTYTAGWRITHFEACKG